MIPALTSPEHRRFARFIAAGIVNTLFGYGVFAAAIAAGAGHRPALALATALGVLFNFVTSSRFVFGVASKAVFLRFVAMHLSVLALNAAALDWLVGRGIGPLLAQAMIVPAAVVCTYLASRKFVFQDRVG